MRIEVQTDLPQVADIIRKLPETQLPFATALALNKTAEIAQGVFRDEMRSKFNNPTPWFLNTLRIRRATKTDLKAEVGFKDDAGGDFNNNPMVGPHIYGGARRMKAMEIRLQRVGYMPNGWYVVPGAGAKLDANGNMSRGQITQLLNVLGTYTEAGYNKANAATRAKLKKGTRKSYGFEYWVNPANDGRGKKQAKHLLPGVYQRIATPFGSSLKPILIFVKATNYQIRLNMQATIQPVVAREFPVQFNLAMNQALRTALLRKQLTLL